jgi:hypothetical protein
MASLNYYQTIEVISSGSPGVSTGSTTVTIPTGRVLAFAVAYSAAPATTDVTVTNVLPTSEERAILTLTDNNTDFGLTELVNDPVDAAGAAETAAPRNPIVSGSIRVDVAQSDDTAVHTVTLLIMPLEQPVHVIKTF